MSIRLRKLYKCSTSGVCFLVETDAIIFYEQYLITIEKEKGQVLQIEYCKLKNTTGNDTIVVTYGYCNYIGFMAQEDGKWQSVTINFGEF